MKINLSDEMLAEIGKITIVWSYIEHSLAEMIGTIVTMGGRRRELGMIVTAELSFKQRVNILDSLVRFALGDAAEPVADFARVKPLLFEAEQLRNTIVHSVWAKQSNASDPNAIIRMKATAKHKKGLRNDYVAMSLDDLRKVTDTIARAYGQLCMFELYFQEDDADGLGTSSVTPDQTVLGTDNAE